MYADPVLGRTVEIQHDYGLTTVYGNFGEILWKKASGYDRERSSARRSRRQHGALILKQGKRKAR